MRPAEMSTTSSAEGTSEPASLRDTTPVVPSSASSGDILRHSPQTGHLMALASLSTPLVQIPLSGLVSSSLPLNGSVTLVRFHNLSNSELLSEHCKNSLDLAKLINPAGLVCVKL